MKAGFTNDFAYAPAGLQHLVVDVPGIITLGPQLLFGIGAAVSADGAVSATLGRV